MALQSQTEGVRIPELPLSVRSSLGLALLAFQPFVLCCFWPWVTQSSQLYKLMPEIVLGVDWDLRESSWGSVRLQEVRQAAHGQQTASGFQVSMLWGQCCYRQCDITVDPITPAQALQACAPSVLQLAWGTFLSELCGMASYFLIPLFLFIFIAPESLGWNL